MPDSPKKSPTGDEFTNLELAEVATEDLNTAALAPVQRRRNSFMRDPPWAQ